MTLSENKQRGNAQRRQGWRHQSLDCEAQLTRSKFALSSKLLGLHERV
jgi:hypothetical protein